MAFVYPEKSKIKIRVTETVNTLTVVNTFTNYEECH